MSEPSEGLLRRTLEQHPADRGRLARAVGSLLAVAVVGLAAIGFLVIWHLVRRGRMIREGLQPPRNVRLPEIDRTAAPQENAAEGTSPPPAPSP